MSKSPISYPGGKFHLADKIISLFPEHTLYVEVFGGAGHILFKKPVSACEIYNDIDRNLVCFFSSVKDKSKCGIIYDMLAATPYSRDTFNKCLYLLTCDDITKLNLIENSDNEVVPPNAFGISTSSTIERAYCFAVVNRQSFGSMGETWGVDLKSSKTASSFHNSKELLNAACDRLKNIQLENSDFRYIIKRYDRPDTLFYLDPPYAWDNRSCRKIYKNEMNETDHIQLVDILIGIKGKVILSGYDTVLYNRLVDAGWRKISLGNVSVTLNMKIGESRIRKQEFVWVNF
ncbi:MAG: DNA adenine methylase [Oscillospiraceae bacterium]|nr:DNA adenine methylase [Oscillospiraceae bacterium]